MKTKRKFNYARRIISLFLVLCMATVFLPTTVFAANGPSTGEYSFAWVRICTEKENGEVNGYNIWCREGEIDTVQGVSYNEETNTLTLTNVNMPDYWLVTNEMGDDFKVELVGDNHLLYLYSYGDYWGGSVELTGNGSLTLNEKKGAKCTPITLEAESSNAAFIADSTVTLTVYKESGNPNIAENHMTLRKENAIQFNGKTDDVEITTEEIQKYKTLPVFYSVSEYSSTFDEYYTKDDDGKTYVMKKWYYVDENGEVTDEGYWTVYGVAEVDHPTVSTGKIIVEVEDLHDDPETQGYTKHEGEISANELGSGSSSIRIVKNTATGKEYAYVIDWIDNTYTLCELVAELEGFDAGWGAGDIWYAAPTEPEITGSVYDGLPAGYEFVTIGGSGRFSHIATGGSDEIFTQTPSEITPTDKAEVSGTVTSYGSDDDDVIIQLIEDGTSEAAYETIVKGNTASYSIGDVLSGTYIMKVMKNNHVTREYTVTVGSQPVVQDVKICLLGDVNMDGNVSIMDATVIQQSIAALTSLNEYQDKLADADKDGRVTIFDVTQIQMYMAKLIDKL